MPGFTFQTIQTSVQAKLSLDDTLKHIIGCLKRFHAVKFFRTWIYLKLFQVRCLTRSACLWSNLYLHFQFSQVLEIPMANLKLYGITWHCNPCKRSSRKWGLEQLKKNLPPTSLCHMLQSSWCPQRARHLAALITNYPANQSLLAMVQLSALHSIGGEWTSNPCSSLFVSPEITTNALHTLTLVCKPEGKKDFFFLRLNWDHITCHAKCKAWNCRGGFSPLTVARHESLSLHQFISMPFVWASVCLIEWKTTWFTMDVTLLPFPSHLLYLWKIAQFWAQDSSLRR